MKRLHVHVGVDNLQTSVRFYSALFGAEPTIVQTDYAKCMLDDPRVNFVISHDRAQRGIEHLGIQVETEAELGEVYARLKTAARPVLDEGATTCCYAKSSKSGIADPQGVVWEAFLTRGGSTVYGGGPAMASIFAPTPIPAVANESCCEPIDPQAVICSAPTCCAA